MSTDNRYQLNDCDANTGFTGDDTANAIATTGSFVEGAGALSTQLSNANEQMNTTQDSTGAGTFNVDLSDSTIYAVIKDNLNDSFANGGAQNVVGDGTNLVGYACGGNNAKGFPYELFFQGWKTDLSVHVASPGTNNAYAGTEAALSQAAITQMGYGSLHLAKAVGSVDNVIMDGFYYLANGSYALTINGGTAGTPETMTDVEGDDVTNGWCLVNNPKGSEFGFFGPTEWGNATTIAEHAFTSDGEQWYLVGDNQGGHTVGAGNFPFRLVSNATDTGSWIVNDTVIVGTGTRPDWLMDDANFNTIEMDSCQWSFIGTIALPSSGGTSRFTTNTIFADTDQITNNGADMDGCTILASIVAADVGALLYNEASDPDGTLDNLTIEKGAAAHHAIDFGTNVDSTLVSITLRGCNFVGFGATDDANDSTVRFLATTGALTLNLIDCTVDGSPASASNFSVDDAAGITVTVVIAPVDLTITVKDKLTLAVIQNVQTSIQLKDSPFTQLMNEDTNASGIATEQYSGTVPVDVVWKTRKSEDTDNPRYRAASSIETITTSGLNITVLLEQNPILN